MAAEPFCQRKVTYMSKADAKLALKRAKAHGANVRREYRCPQCGFWHLTKHTATQYLARLAGAS